MVDGNDEGAWVLGGVGEVSSSAVVAIETVVDCVFIVLVEPVAILLLSRGAAPFVVVMVTFSVESSFSVMAPSWSSRGLI